MKILLLLVCVPIVIGVTFAAFALGATAAARRCGIAVNGTAFPLVVVSAFVFIAYLAARFLTP